VKLGDYDYYLNEDGTTVKGKVVIDGQTHYFTSAGANSAPNRPPLFCSAASMISATFSCCPSLTISPLSALRSSAISAGSLSGS